MSEQIAIIDTVAPTLKRNFYSYLTNYFPFRVRASRSPENRGKIFNRVQSRRYGRIKPIAIAQRLTAGLIPEKLG